MNTIQQTSNGGSSSKPKQISVPRVWDITGSKTQEQKVGERLWRECRKEYVDANQHQYGTRENREVWLAKTRKLRSY